ncbi:MAG: hypothetical protein OWT28_09115 [Firmicutes bacterium]|nr:hypothetical protein [Bacillota bacterium]
MRCWILRPSPHGTNQISYFLSEGRVAIGYPVGHSFAGCSYDEIRAFLEQKGWEAGLGNVARLVQDMSPDDLLVIPDGREIYFAEVTGNYVYVPELDDDLPGSGFPHQRPVRFFFDGRPVPRETLPKELLESLRFPGTIAEITKHRDVILSITEAASPADVGATSSEWTRLVTKSTALLERLLDGDDIEYALRAAQIVLSHK